MSAREIIKRHEGLRLKAYPDPASGGDPWTIGYGSTRNVHKGMVITLEEAEHRLDDDMAEAYACVDHAVTVPLDYRQRDALCSFVFNVGCGAFRKSTLLKLLNSGDYLGAGAQFPRWNKAAGKVMPGLVKRRGAERALFLSGTNTNNEPFVRKEDEMAPLAVAVLTQAIPALVSKLPEIASIFKNPNVRERNVEAVGKVAEILVQSTGSANVQEAVEKIESSPEIAETANEALRLNRADLLDLLERVWDKDEQSVKAAREFSTSDQPVVGKWHFVHILSMLLVVLGGSAAAFVLGTSDDSTERAMALQTLMLVGFASVVAFWLGSSRSSQMKDVLRK